MPEQELHKAIRGLKQLKSIVIFALIYRFIGPVLINPIANKISGHFQDKAQEKKKLLEKMKHMHEGGCPGSRILTMHPKKDTLGNVTMPAQISQLGNWPVQIKLAPVNAPYFDSAKLLIAADCTAYAYANFHQEFIRGKVTLIGCPKLDAVDYSEKLTQIIANNEIQSVTIVRMEVPCCGGIEMAAKKALQASGKFIQWQVVTIGIDGTIKED